MTRHIGAGAVLAFLAVGLFLLVLAGRMRWVDAIAVFVAAVVLAVLLGALP